MASVAKTIQTWSGEHMSEQQKGREAASSVRRKRKFLSDCPTCRAERVNRKAAIRLKMIARILEQHDNELLAADGPVPQEPLWLRKIYLLATKP